VDTVPSYAFDTTTLEATPGAVTTHVVQASPILRMRQSWGSAEGDEAMGGNKARGEAFTYVAQVGLGFVPDMAQVVRFDSSTWRIVGVDPIYSGEKINVYKLILAGGQAPTGTSRTTELDGILPDTAIELVQQFGKHVYFHVDAVDTFNTLDLSATQIDEDVYCLQAALTNYSRNMAPGSTRSQGRIRAYLPNYDDLAFAPFKKQRVTIDGDDWTMESVFPIMSGSEIAVWRLELSRKP